MTTPRVTLAPRERGEGRGEGRSRPTVSSQPKRIITPLINTSPNPPTRNE